MTLEEYRQAYPQYDQIPDRQLADALFDKYYAGKFEKKEFYSQIGLQQAGYEPPKEAEPYMQKFTETEESFGLPPNLLARMAQQESNFREEIISGEKKSKAGAVGIMQIVPKWHPDVDPTNPDASIEYAGDYIKQLYDRFGSWEKALAAYNWGPSNVNKWSGNKDDLPKETRNYVEQIMGDLEIDG